MTWRSRAELLCRRHGFPTPWIERFADEGEPSGDPRETVRRFEAWCLERLGEAWTGRADDLEVDGRVAALLVQRYLADAARPLVFRYRLSAEELDDLVAAASERAMRVFAERKVEQPRAYMLQALRRATWEHIRKARREVPTEPNELPPVPVGGVDPEQGADWADTMKQFLDHCYDRLKPKERELLEGLVVHGLTAASVGERMGIAANAVNVRKFRIRKWLRECLQERLGVEDPFA